MQAEETWVQSLGWEDPLEEDMATQSNTLAWRIPWTEESGGYSPEVAESDMTEVTAHTHSPRRALIALHCRLVAKLCSTLL